MLLPFLSAHIEKCGYRIGGRSKGFCPTEFPLGLIRVYPRLNRIRRAGSERQEARWCLTKTSIEDMAGAKAPALPISSLAFICVNLRLNSLRHRGQDARFCPTDSCSEEARWQIFTENRLSEKSWMRACPAWDRLRVCGWRPWRREPHKV